jgi:hypothetical protein
MRDVRAWLPVTLVFASLLLPGCTAADTSMGGLPAPEPGGERLMIDLAAGTAATSAWRSSTVDCSDQNYFCLLIPDRMVLAFPRLCALAMRDDPPPTARGVLRGVAPAPHLVPPSGSYVVDSFPRMLLRYWAHLGLFEVREVVNSPSEPNFNPNNLVTRYSIVTSDGSKLFVCS